MDRPSTGIGALDELLGGSVWATTSSDRHRTQLMTAPTVTIAAPTC
jgi:hypothetical protein